MEDNYITTNDICNKHVTRLSIFFNNNKYIYIFF